ncbi:photoactive yellow protein [Thiohalorhabdus sp.]|uniref:photoactive yellow protein n=1 Tax=Thiohalorhabdus sp. TaxID=3094134 RepID=UPI002FC2C325
MTERLRFESDNIFNALADMDGEAMNSLPFGVIRLDREGTILEYNLTEGQLTGTDPRKVMGQNFFRDVAPCTVNPQFYGRFVEGLEKGELDTVFEYIFDHQMATERVKVHMRKSGGEDSVWILVKRL